MVKPATEHVLIWWPCVDPNLPCDEVYYEVHNAQGLCVHSGLVPLQSLHSRPWALGLADRAVRCSVWVLLHPADVLLLAPELPAVRGRKLDEALPYVVEPAILNAPEDNYVTHWPMASHHPKPMVAVVSKALVAQVLAQCQAAQLQCLGVSCEVLRSPMRTPVVWLQGEYAVWIDGVAPPLCVPTQPVELARHALGQRCQDTPCALVLGASSKSSKAFKTIKALLPEGLGLETTKAGLEPCLGLLNKSLVPRHAAPAAGLQAVNGRSSGFAWQPWAWGGLVVLLLWVVGLQVAAWHTHSRQQQLQAQVAARFQEVLPNTPLVADPVLLLERELRTLAGASAAHATAGQGLVNVLDTVATTVPEAPAHALRGMMQEGTAVELLFASPLSADSQNRVLQALQAKGHVASWQAGRLRVQTKESP